MLALKALVMSPGLFLVDCAGVSCAFLHTPGAEGDWPLYPVPPWQALRTDSLLFVI